MNGTVLPAAAVQPKGTSDVLAALESIEPGQLIVYYTGRLCNDRADKFDQRSLEVDRVGKRAYEMAAKQNRVHLTQFKYRGGYAYVATGKAGCGRSQHN